MKKNTNNKAFSLIEVLVFVTILALFFVSAAAVVTASLRNMKINEHKIIASHYTEELLEWFRGEKETNWNDFVDKDKNLFITTDRSGSTISTCFNFKKDDPITWTTSTCDFSHGGLYNRKAWFVLKDTTKTQIDVYINVTWKELNNDYLVPLRSTFSIWE